MMHRKLVEFYESELSYLGGMSINALSTIAMLSHRLPADQVDALEGQAVGWAIRAAHAALMLRPEWRDAS